MTIPSQTIPLDEHTMLQLDPDVWKPIGFQGDGESVVTYDPFEAQFFHLKTPWGDGRATIDTDTTGIESFIEFLKVLKSEMEDNL